MFFSKEFVPESGSGVSPKRHSENEVAIRRIAATMNTLSCQSIEKLGYLIMLRFLLLLSILAVCSCASTSQAEKRSEAPRAKPTTPRQTTNLRDIELQTFELVNDYRRSKGLKPLQLNEKISAAARSHSEDMASKRVDFGHDGFESRTDRLNMPFSSVAENVAWNKGMDYPAREAVESWIDSSGHRKNMEGRFTLTGLGVARDPKGAIYFTQIFLQPE